VPRTEAQAVGYDLWSLLMKGIDKLNRSRDRKERETMFICLHILSMRFLHSLFSVQWRNCVRKQVKFISFTWDEGYQQTFVSLICILVLGMRWTVIITLKIFRWILFAFNFALEYVLREAKESQRVLETERKSSDFTSKPDTSVRWCSFISQNHTYRKENRVNAVRSH
jgi:hypothetical protein